MNPDLSHQRASEEDMSRVLPRTLASRAVGGVGDVLGVEVGLGVQVILKKQPAKNPELNGDLRVPPRDGVVIKAGLEVPILRDIRRDEILQHR